MKLWKHQTQFDPNEVNWKSLTVAILASFFFTLYCETVVWNSRPSECDRMAIGKKLSAKKIAHVNLALLLQPPPLRIFTMTPNCPPTHTHFPWSLRGTNWHIYMLMFPIGYTSSSPFFFSFCLLSAQSPTLSAPRAFFAAPVFFHHHLLPLWLILNSSPLGYIWPGDLKHITLPPSLLPHLPPSLSPSE